MGLSTRAAATLFFVYMFGLVLTQTEHKVHNIVLYPHKHSWCKTTAILQVVAHPGCNPIEVENNVCVGGCFSYSIPRTIPSSPGEVAPYCDSCRPHAHSWRQVVLNCTSGEYEGGTLSKMVEIIDNCTCTKCREHSTIVDEYEIEPSTGTLIDSTLPLHDNSSQDNDTTVSERTMVLLTDLTEEEGGEGEALDDQNALREILHNVDNSGGLARNEGLMKDLLRRVQENGKMNVDLKVLERVAQRGEQPHINGHRHNQHMLVGPHHSLVQEPVEYLKPTLDVPSHMFKPAHDGLELSYHNNLEPFGLDEE